MLAAAAALLVTVTSVDAARKLESHDAVAARVPHVGGFDLASATDDEAAALAVELGLSLAEHDDPAYAGASTYVGVTQTRERAN